MPAFSFGIAERTSRAGKHPPRGGPVAPHVPFLRVVVPGLKAITFSVLAVFLAMYVQTEPPRDVPAVCMSSIYDGNGMAHTYTPSRTGYDITGDELNDGFPVFISTCPFSVGRTSTPMVYTNKLFISKHESTFKETNPDQFVPAGVSMASHLAIPTSVIAWRISPLVVLVITCIVATIVSAVELVSTVFMRVFPDPQQLPPAFFATLWPAATPGKFTIHLSFLHNFYGQGTVKGLGDIATRCGLSTTILLMTGADREALICLNFIVIVCGCLCTQTSEDAWATVARDISFNEAKVTKSDSRFKWRTAVVWSIMATWILSLQAAMMYLVTVKTDTHTEIQESLNADGADWTTFNQSCLAYVTYVYIAYDTFVLMVTNLVAFVRFQVAATPHAAILHLFRMPIAVNICTFVINTTIVVVLMLHIGAVQNANTV